MCSRIPAINNFRGYIDGDVTFVFEYDILCGEKLFLHTKKFAVELFEYIFSFCYNVKLKII